MFFFNFNHPFRLNLASVSTVFSMASLESKKTPLRFGLGSLRIPLIYRSVYLVEFEAVQAVEIH